MHGAARSRTASATPSTTNKRPAIHPNTRGCRPPKPRRQNKSRLRHPQTLVPKNILRSNYKMPPILSFCKLASQRIHSIAAKSSLQSVLVSVQGGGCGGLKYMIEPMHEPPNSLDEQLTLGESHVVVCGHSLLHILGTNVTWIDDHMGSRFSFENPNAGNTCGCGSTFSPKTK